MGWGRGNEKFKCAKREDQKAFSYTVGLDLRNEGVERRELQLRPDVTEHRQLEVALVEVAFKFVENPVVGNARNVEESPHPPRGFPTPIIIINNVQ